MLEDWSSFYVWLESKGYHVYRNSNVFREDMFITHFDCQEDDDSGEIEETINRIKEIDVFNF
mgnify:CR=1 FL=1|tara:strand:- start:310 stop:495 length:186 start_codon:yes stop_codon:yes gene_type:complete